MSAGPLQGVRVLDFGNFLAGPFGSMLLADLGADVVKVESPQGDPMRPMDRLFAGCQRGKRGLALDLKHERAPEILARLVAGADVVHHNFRPGAAERAGIGYADVARVRPDVIYCETPAYGTAGPRASWGGFDQLFQAFCGFEQAGGGEGNPPMWYRAGFLDYAAAMLSAGAIAMALLHRARTGEGQRVEASILSAGLTTRSEVCLDERGDRIGRPAVDRQQTGYGPLYRIYPTSSGWLALAASQAEDYARLRSAPSLVGLPAVPFPDARQSPALAEALEARLATRSAAEWASELGSSGVPCEVVAEDQEERFLTSAAAEDDGLVATYEHPTLGRMRQVGTLIRFSEDHVVPRLPMPLLGQHSKELLAELGYSEIECEELKDSGATTWPGQHLVTGTYVA